MSKGEQLSFIHLSDIHFNKYSSDYYDIDSDLRNEILLDIEASAKSQLMNVKGVLVCGDIAFSGKEEEYKIALDFLSELCARLEIPESMVFCVPGNHDVDQAICKNSPILSEIQDSLESAHSQIDIDNSIRKYMHDPQANVVMLSQLAAYNSFFAGKFDCTIDAKKLYWDDTIKLDDKYSLYIRGMTSVLISSSKDHSYEDKDRPMIIGRCQVPLRKNNTIVLTLCHHPPECWNDPEDATKKLMSARSHIQLYGHKHVQTTKLEERSLIIGSGAAQPSRKEEQWVPYYNWISFNVNYSNNHDYLEIKLYPRIFDIEHLTFKPDTSVLPHYKASKLFTLQLDHCTETNNVKKIDEPSDIKESDGEETYEKVEPMDEFIYKRTLIYKFMSLPLLVRSRILVKFGLLEDGDRGIGHNYILDKIINTAVEKNCLDQLQTEIYDSLKI
jgi:predicted phosphodiesterase